MQVSLLVRITIYFYILQLTHFTQTNKNPTVKISDRIFISYYPNYTMEIFFKKVYFISKFPHNGLFHVELLQQ